MLKNSADSRGERILREIESDRVAAAQHPAVLGSLKRGQIAQNRDGSCRMVPGPPSDEPITLGDTL